MADLLVILLPPLLFLLGCLLPHRRIAADRLLLAGSVLFLVPFAAAVACCFPCLDDWAYGASGRAGWWEAQGGWYGGWSGRISATAVASAWGAIGSPWFSAVIGYRSALLALLALLAWAVHDLLAAREPGSRGAGRFLPACAALAGWIAAMPGPTEGLYWLNGAATYTLGMAVALVVVSSTVRALDGQAWRWRLAAALAIPAALFSEVVSAMLCASLALLCLRAWRSPDRWRCAAVAALAAGGALLLVSAPGNGVRLAAVMAEGTAPPSSDPLALAGRIRDLVAAQAGSGAFAALFAMAAALSWRTRDGAAAKPAPAGSAAWVLVPLAGALPMAWVGIGPPRAWNTIFLVVAIGVVAMAGRAAGRRWVPGAWLGLAGLSLLAAAPPGAEGAGVLVLGWLAGAAVLWLRRDRIAQPSAIALAACALLLGAQLWRTAVVDVFGKGPGYIAQQQRRLGLVARLPPGTAARVALLEGDLPYLYHREDVHIAAATWQNRGMAAFFGLASIRATTDPAAVSGPAR